jgi:cytochrome P450
VSFTREIPDHVPAELVRVFNHFNDAEVQRDPIGFYDEIRRSERPIFYSPLFGGFWVLTKFAHQLEVLQSPQRFRNEHMSFPGKSVWPRKLIPVEMDPPEHKPFKAIEARAFSPARMRDLEDGITADVRALLTPILARGQCDFFTDFGQPLPTTVFCRLFGLPLEQASDFLAWERDLIHGSNQGEDVVKRQEAGRRISEYLEALVQSRIERPADDLVTHLTQSVVDGERLTFEQVFDMCFQLYVAGLDTVTAALTLSFVYLATHADARNDLRHDPGLIPNAIEELLRRNSFICLNRVAQEDVEIGGVTIRAGDVVLLPLQSGSRDEELAEDSDRVDFRRRGIRHIAFGAGPHRCVGSHLARIELTCALREWFAMTEDFELAPGREIRYHAAGASGIRSLPLIVTPREL